MTDNMALQPELAAPDTISHPRIVKAAWGFALLSLFLCALVYPLQFDMRIASAIGIFLGKYPGGRALFAFIEPFIRFGFSPLTIKEVAAAWAILPLIALWITWKALSPRNPRHSPFRMEIILLVLFLIWSLLSTFWAPHFGLDSHITYTAFSFCIWMLFLFALIDLPKPRRFSKFAIASLLIVGLILMLISLGEAISGISRYVFLFMPRLDSIYKRNIYGSLIGHNTGVASICMGPFFFAVGFLFLTRRKWLRIALLLYVLISLFFFIVTQSRSIWLLFVLMTPAFLLGLRSIIKTPIRLRHFLYGILLILVFIGLQFVPGKWNVLHVREAQFKDRLRSLTPKVLITETRLRILAVSLPLIAQRPIIGHGLDSFWIIYPPAQGEYFARYPDSILTPTNLLTQQAHDDYLQLLLETGLIGFGLALAGAIFFIRRGYLRFKQIQSPSERLFRYCALFALLQVLLHAFLDFPFHIAPLALFFLFYCAIWYGSESDIPAREEEIAHDALSAPSRASVRPRQVLILVAIMLTWGMLIPAYMFSANWLISDRYFSKGMGLMTYYLQEMRDKDANQQADTLFECRDYFKQALRRDPLDYMSQLQLAISNLSLANLHAAQWRQSMEKKDSKQAALSWANAIRLEKTAIQQTLRAGIMEPATTAQPPEAMNWFEKVLHKFSSAMITQSREAMNDAPGIRVNHTSFLMLARSWALIASLAPVNDPQKMELFIKDLKSFEPDLTTPAQKALDYYQLSLRYSPVQPEVIADMIDFMAVNRLGSRDQRKYYFGIMAHFNPDELKTIYLERAHLLGEQQRYNALELLMRDILESAPDKSIFPEFYNYLAQACLAQRDTAKYHDTVQAMLKGCPTFPGISNLVVNDLLMQHRYADAESLLRSSLANKTGNALNLQILLSETLRLHGKAKESEDLFAKVLADSPSVAQAYSDRGMIRRMILGDEAEALRDYETAVTSPNSNVISDTIYISLINSYHNAGDTAGAERILELAKDRLGRNLALRQLRDQILPKKP